MDLLLLAAVSVTALVTVIAAIWVAPAVILAAIAVLADDPGRDYSSPAASSSVSRS